MNRKPQTANCKLIDVTMRWLLLDEILEIRPKNSARSRSRIPGSGVSPEVLMIEMMAQTGGLVLGAEKDFSEDVIFTKIQSVRFGSGWRVGEPVEIESVCEQFRAEGAWFRGTVRGSEGLIGESRFLLMNVGHLVAGESHSITFHENFMRHFRIRDKMHA